MPTTEQEKVDVAMRVIADHIRTLSFAIADGIQPGNTDRNYVLRRILRRAVRYGRTLGFTEPFFYKLTAILARTMGDVFPNIRERQKHMEEVLKREEEAFNKTLDRGISLFNDEVARLTGNLSSGLTRAITRKRGARASSPFRPASCRNPFRVGLASRPPVRTSCPNLQPRAPATRNAAVSRTSNNPGHLCHHLLHAGRRVLSPASRTIVLDALGAFPSRALRTLRGVCHAGPRASSSSAMAKGASRDGRIRLLAASAT